MQIVIDPDVKDGVAPVLGRTMPNEGSNGSTPDSGHAYGKLDVELLLRGERDSRRQVLQMSMEQILQLPEEERAIVLDYLATG
ncbi:hypothetical protein GJ744_011006 [Endocarpon pusillum]|uniref:Uncharacterized protein n=1 Tax=Endocarpon pusillum TaxID=364733 RepID=A0A8H7ADF3_9EURO|nr:hypothetical protein GJ744_011006 [Endocarpon pusillum]